MTAVEPQPAHRSKIGAGTGRRQGLWPAFLAPSQHGDDALCTVSARGSRVTLLDGRTLIDGASGLWNVNLGYGNEAVVEAVARALRDASYLSVFRYENAWARDAADALLERCPTYARVIFSTSGGAAVDAATKLARHAQALAGQPRRDRVVGLQQSYHGLTFGAFALTGEDLGQRMYGVDRRLVRHVPANALDDLERLMEREGSRVAAVVVEPVLGTGAVVLASAYVDRLLELRARHGFLLVADEVATGFCRTGPLFASGRWAEPPDVLLTSKGLTNGTCAGAALLVAPHIARRFTGTDAQLTHGETQAGTPPTAAAVCATLAEVRRLDAERRSAELAARLDRHLLRLRAVVPGVETTGAGCFRSVRLHVDGRPLPQTAVPSLVAAVRAEGAIVHPGPQGFQLVPILTSTEADLDELMTAAERGLTRVLEGVVRMTTAPPPPLVFDSVDLLGSWLDTRGSAPVALVVDDGLADRGVVDRIRRRLRWIGAPHDVVPLAARARSASRAPPPHRHRERAGARGGRGVARSWTWCASRPRPVPPTASSSASNGPGESGSSWSQTSSRWPRWSRCRRRSVRAQR